MATPNWVAAVIAIIVSVVIGLSGWLLLVPSYALPATPAFPDGGYVPGGRECSALLGDAKGARTKRGAECRDALMAYRLTHADLIQQAKAANAVEAANRLNQSHLRAAAVQAITGVFTLLAAVFAALYAKSAVNEARRGVKATEDSIVAANLSSSIQLRAYVGLDSYDSVIERIKLFRYQHTATLRLTNFGQTPTGTVSIRSAVVITDESPDPGWISEKEWEDLGIISQDRSVEYYIKGELTKKDINSLKQSSFKIALVGEIRYTDVFGAGHHYRFALTSSRGDRWETRWSDEEGPPPQSMSDV